MRSSYIPVYQGVTPPLISRLDNPHLASSVRDPRSLVIESRRWPILVILTSLLFQVPLAADLAGQNAMPPPLNDEPSFFYIQAEMRDYFENLQTANEGEDGEYARFKRWEMFWEHRVTGHPGDRPGSFDHMKDANAEFLEWETCSSFSEDPYSSWTNLGPFGNVSEGNSTSINAGRVNACAVDPNNPDVMFAGSGSGSLFRTLNGTALTPLWEPVLDDLRLPGLSVNEIIFSPSSSAIYVCTGVGNFASFGDNGYGRGILKSTDNGDTWSLIGPYEPETSSRIEKLVLDPNNEDILYTITDQRIYKSIDQGSTWSEKHQLPDSEGQDQYNPNSDANRFFDLEIHPTDSDILYCCSHLASAARVNNTNSGAVFYFSHDGGENWTAVNPFTNESGPDPYDLLSGGTGALNIVMGTSIAEPNSVWMMLTEYVSGGQNGTDIDIKRYFMKSLDAGESWLLVSNTSTISSDSQTFKALDLIISPTDSDIIYLNPGGYQYGHKSINGGSSFTALTNPGHVDVRDIKLLESSTGGSEDRLLVAHDGGIAILESGGQSSSAKRQVTGEGMANNQFHGIGASNFGRYPAGSMDNHIFIFDKDYWFKVNSSNDGGDAVMDKYDPDVFYGQTWCCDDDSEYLNEHTWDGTVWVKSNIKPVGASNTAHVVRPMEHHVTGDLYVGYQDLYRQAAPGLTTTGWTKLSEFDGNYAGVTEDDAMRDFQVAPSDDQVIYAVFTDPCWCEDGTEFEGYLYKTTTGGGEGLEDWTDITMSLPISIWKWFVPRKIMVNPSDSDELWLAFGGYEFDEGEDGPFNGKNRVIHSMDGGDTWEDFSEGLTRFPVNDIIYQEGRDVIYAATDAGIFYRDLRDPASTWSCFMNNAPIAFYLDLEIDYCKQELVVGTYGRAMWSSPLVPMDTRTIESSQTWSGNIAYHSDILIPEGVTLTLTGTLLMPGDAKIEVESGGRLVVNGGTITNLCGERWNGIYVAGIPQGQSASSGRLTLINGATLENATSAVHNYLLNADGSMDWNSTGGVIHANNAIFRNNRSDLRFQAYQNYSGSNPVRDYSSFRNCDFILDENFPADETPLEASAAFWECNGVRFQGCEFLDQRPELARWEKRMGIILGNSTVEVNELCPPGQSYPAPITCDGGQPSSFIGLSDGIHSYGVTHPLFNTKVRNSEFKNCWNGIYLLGSDRAEIWLNDFEVTPGPSVPDLTLEMPTGIYLHHATTGFHIEGNAFYPSENSMEPDGNSTCFGIVANTMTGENNDIYRNSFKHLRLGFESIATNRGVDQDGDFTGLKLRCNTFEGDMDDWYMTIGEDDQLPHLGIHRDQGIIPDNLADNSFKSSSYNSNILNDDTDFTNYRFNNSPVLQFQEPTLAFTVPDNLFVVPFYNGNDLTNCPTETIDQNGGEIIQGKAQAQIERHAQEALLAELVDGGDTEWMQAEVQTTTSLDAWQKYLDLMAEAGYLSEEVLKEVALKEEGFTLAMIRDILVANPQAAKSKEVEEKLDERSTQLPEYMREQIKLGLTQMSPKEYLQMVKDGYQYKFDKAMMDLYREVLRDSLPSDSVSILFTELSASGNLAMDYRLVELYDATGQSNVADVLLGVMDSGDGLKGEEKVAYDRYVAYRSLMNGWRAEGKDLSALGAVDIAQLEDFADGVDRTAVNAFTLLKNNEATEERHRELYLPNNGKSLRNGKVPMDFLNGALSVFPNPAKDHVTIDYRIDRAFQNALFRIIDQKGVVMKEALLRSDRNQILIPLDLIPGSYRCEILVDGISYLSTQLVIQ